MCGRRLKNLKVIGDNMAKKFSELKAGDSVWIWWYTELYEYGVQELNPVKQFLITDEGKAEIESNGEARLYLKGGAEFAIYSDCANTEVFIYGSDGHEYKILGTSKDAVRRCLEDTLNRDIEELKNNTERWLSEF